MTALGVYASLNPPRRMRALRHESSQYLSDSSNPPESLKTFEEYMALQEGRLLALAGWLPSKNSIDPALPSLVPSAPCNAFSMPLSRGMSVKTVLPPTAQTSCFQFSGSTRALSQSGSAMQSESVKARKSPLAAPAPLFLPLAGVAADSSTINLKFARLPATFNACEVVPSVDPASTRITSMFGYF